MKKMMLMLLIAGVAVGAMAQTRKEVKGAVIDKYGNSLPGVRIEATGGAEGTVTDADGTFTLEVSRWLKSLTATYPGMKKKKAKIVDNADQNILITMHSGSDKTWFVNGIYQLDLIKEFGTFGLMAGQLGNWGWYGKIAIDAINRPKSWDGATLNPYPSISAGVIKKVSDNIYAYVGVGHTKCYRKSSDTEKPGVDAVLIDLGAMAKLGAVNINLGASLGHGGDNLFQESEGYDRTGLHVGVGYVF